MHIKPTSKVESDFCKNYNIHIQKMLTYLIVLQPHEGISSSFRIIGFGKSSIHWKRKWDTPIIFQNWDSWQPNQNYRSDRSFSDGLYMLKRLSTSIFFSAYNKISKSHETVWYFTWLPSRLKIQTPVCFILFKSY